jgi:hypothetical protein
LQECPGLEQRIKRDLSGSLPIFRASFRIALHDIFWFLLSKSAYSLPFSLHFCDSGMDIAHSLIVDADA